MHRFNKLSNTQRAVFQFLSRNTLSLEKIKELSGLRGVSKAVEKLVALSLVEKNDVGSFYLTPAGALIWERNFSIESQESE